MWLRLLLINIKDSFVSPNPLYIVIDITECYVPALRIKSSENKFRIGGFLWNAFMGNDMKKTKTKKKKRKEKNKKQTKQKQQQSTE